MVTSHAEADAACFGEVASVGVVHHGGSFGGFEVNVGDLGIAYHFVPVNVSLMVRNVNALLVGIVDSSVGGGQEDGCRVCHEMFRHRFFAQSVGLNGFILRHASSVVFVFLSCVCRKLGSSEKNGTNEKTFGEEARDKHVEKDIG